MLSTVLTPTPESRTTPEQYAQRAAATLEAMRVTRYHAVPSVAPQTVGLHSIGVLLIVLYLEPWASRPLIIEAAMHDSAELFTGDVPYTVKRDNEDIKTRFDLMEDTARRESLLFSPISLTEGDKALLKLADTLDGFIWCQKTELSGPVKDRWVQAFRKAVQKFASVTTVAQIQRAIALFELFGGRMEEKL